MDEKTSQECLISLKGVHKDYSSAAGIYHALRNVDLSVCAAELVAIVGKSGSGKTTLMNLLAGLDKPTAGEIMIQGQPLHTMTENQLSNWRGRTVGVVFQFFQLLPTMSMVENVMLPMDFCNTYPKQQRRERALDLLHLVGLSDQAYKFPTALSGGQQQRAAIARALANNPPIILADEPTGNLDSNTADDVFSMFEALVQGGKTILLITHDKENAARCSRCIQLADGKLVC